jgi:transcription elongation factor GreA
MVASALQKAQLTKDGRDEIEKELKELEEVKLPAVIQRVETARAYGDLSENAEYHSAKEDQDLVETRIAELKNILQNSVIVKQTHKSSSVGMGSQVVVSIKGSKSKKKITFQIVGEFEAEPQNGKISSVSPLGQALMDKKKGEVVEVEAPAGKVSYLIEEIK